jgi:hypothetical protein
MRNVIDGVMFILRPGLSVAIDLERPSAAQHVVRLSRSGGLGTELKRIQHEPYVKCRARGKSVLRRIPIANPRRPVNLSV